MLVLFELGLFHAAVHAWPLTGWKKPCVARWSSEYRSKSELEAPFRARAPPEASLRFRSRQRASRRSTATPSRSVADWASAIDSSPQVTEWRSVSCVALSSSRSSKSRPPQRARRRSPQRLFPASSLGRKPVWRVDEPVTLQQETTIGLLPGSRTEIFPRKPSGRSVRSPHLSVSGDGVPEKLSQAVAGAGVFGTLVTAETPLAATTGALLAASMHQVVATAASIPTRWTEVELVSLSRRRARDPRAEERSLQARSWVSCAARRSHSGSDVERSRLRGPRGK